MIHRANHQYYLTDLGLLMNYINPDLQRKLPQTDTRFRPDLRYYEQGKFRGAEFEKIRMIKATNQRSKEKQELVRSASFKHSVSAGVEFNKSRWFVKKIDPEVAMMPDFYEFKKGPDGYWEKRAKNDW